MYHEFDYEGIQFLPSAMDSGECYACNEALTAVKCGRYRCYCCTNCDSYYHNHSNGYYDSYEFEED